MEITTLGVILALKNLGVFLASLSFTEVRNDPAKFLWMLFIYACINIPSDLYLANHISTQGKEKAKAEIGEGDPSDG